MKYNQLVKDRHLVVNGLNMVDTGTVIEVNWQWHVASCEQSATRYACLGRFVRSEVTYTVWVSRALPRKPTRDGMKELCAQHYAYTLNPFGVEDGS